MRPSRIATTRCAALATRMSCVTSTIVWPSAWLLAQHGPRTSRACGRVEVAGRLVGEQDARAVDERAGDRDTLLLTAGEVAGHTRRHLVEAETLEQICRAAPRLARRDAGQQRGSSTLSATVRFAIRLKNWNTKPTSLRRRPRAPRLARTGQALTVHEHLAAARGGRGRRAG